MALTLKQHRFAREYLLDLNATKAAMRAGYSAATAYSQGHRLLKNVEIKKIIHGAMERRSERTGISADRVFHALGTIGFASMGDYLTDDGTGFPTMKFEGLTKDQMAAIRDIKIERDSEGRRKLHVKLADKLTALALMSRHFERSPDDPELEALPPPPSDSEDRP